MSKEEADKFLIEWLQSSTVEEMDEMLRSAGVVELICPVQASF